MCKTQSDYVDFGKVRHSDGMTYSDYTYEKAMCSIINVSKCMTDASYELFKSEYESGDFTNVYEKLSDSVTALADAMSILGVEDVHGMMLAFGKKRDEEAVGA